MACLSLPKPFSSSGLRSQVRCPPLLLRLDLGASRAPATPQLPSSQTEVITAAPVCLIGSLRATVFSVLFSGGLAHPVRLNDGPDTERGAGEIRLEVQGGWLP